MPLGYCYIEEGSIPAFNSWASVTKGEAEKKTTFSHFIHWNSFELVRRSNCRHHYICPTRWLRGLCVCVRARGEDDCLRIGLDKKQHRFHGLFNWFWWTPNWTGNETQTEVAHGSWGTGTAYLFGLSLILNTQSILLTNALPWLRVKVAKLFMNFYFSIWFYGSDGRTLCSGGRAANAGDFFLNDGRCGDTGMFDIEGGSCKLFFPAYISALRVNNIRYFKLILEGGGTSHRWSYCGCCWTQANERLSS